MNLYKTTSRLKREANDRVIAASFVELRKRYPGESRSNLIMSIAATEGMPYNSPAGVRNSLIRSKTITI